MNQRTNKPLSRSYKPTTGFRPLTGPEDATAVQKQHERTHEAKQKAIKQQFESVLRKMRWLAFSGWIILISALFVVGTAQPQTKTYYHRAQSLNVRQYWNYKLVPIIISLFFLTFIISMVGLFTNLAKGHPKDDFTHINFIILGIASFISICLCLIYLL